jgi:hypothetical protein
VVLAWIAITVGLFFASRYNYLLSHVLAEGFSIAIAGAVFAFAWNTWKLTEHGYLQFLGIALLFVGGLDLLHTLAYKGMNIFPGYDANLPTQLWIAARYLQSLSFLVAPSFLQHKLRRNLWVGIYAALTAALTALIFARFFPDCYIEGQGLTPFKVGSEYLISLLLGGSIWRLYRQREALAPDVFTWMVVALALTIASELAFTLYVGVYELPNLIGHVFKIFAFYYIYHAVIEIGLRRPYTFLFHEMQAHNAQLTEEVAERKRVEKALRKSEERLRTIINALPQFVAYTDKDLTYRFVNRTYQEKFGVEPGEVVGRKLPEVIGAEAFEEARPHVEQALLGKQVRYHERLDYAIGGTRDVDGILVPDVAESGEVHGYYAVLTDITPYMEMQEQLERYADELKRSNEELEQFAHVLSHDLREPARMVKSYLKLLEDRCRDQLDETADVFIDYAVDGATRMQEMIGALLSLSRVGTQGQEPVPTDAEPVLRRTLKSLSMALEEAEAQVTHDPLPTLIADRVQLGQVFQNLIANAIKFRREGVAPHVHVSARREGEEWVLSVADNGIGIHPQQTQWLFQIFQRLHTDEEYPGLGIGLALCKRIVERHGGRIWVESVPGEGSTFLFTLPVAPP